MFNSTVLEVGIGMVFCYCAVSLMVSSINEAIATLFKMRSNQLLDGLKALLNDPGANGLVLDLYNHAMVNPRGSTGKATSTAELCGKPSYIPSKHFALALIDILQNKGQVKQDLMTAIAAITDPQLRQMLQSLYDRAAGDVDQFEARLAGWFDSAMARLAGVYKRRIQLITVLIGLLIAILFNIDTLHLFHSLWIHPGLIQSVTAANAADLDKALSTLNQLPIGWAKPIDYYSAAELLGFVPGWLLTALATLFGAPFWFDLLQKATNLRGSGPAIPAQPN